jgi:hypothetical protein
MIPSTYTFTSYNKEKEAKCSPEEDSAIFKLILMQPISHIHCRICSFGRLRSGQ